MPFKIKITEEIDEELTAFLAGTIGAVEANSFEKMQLQKEALTAGFSWEEQLFGTFRAVGSINNHQICLSLIVSIVKGHRILFYYPTGRMVDYNMINAWLTKAMPESAMRNGKVNKTDAMNFYNLFSRTEGN